jgi:hypothetical protein
MGLFRTGFERAISVQANIILMLHANSNKPVTHRPIDAMSSLSAKEPCLKYLIYFEIFHCRKSCSLTKTDLNET